MIELDDDAQFYLNNGRGKIEQYMSWLIAYHINTGTPLVIPVSSMTYAKTFIEIEDWWYLP